MSYETTRELALVRTCSAPPTDEGLARIQAETADEIERLAVRVREEVREARRSGRFTADGLQERRRELGEETHEQLRARIEAVLAPLEKAREEAGVPLSAEWRTRRPPDMDPDDWRAMQREIRDRVAGMDHTEAQQLYLSACRAGDRLTVAALELAPKPFRVVRPETVEEGRAMFFEAVAPDQFSRHAELAATHNAVEWNLRRGLQEVERLTGVLANDSFLPAESVGAA